MTISKRIALIDENNIIIDVTLYKPEEINDSMIDITDHPKVGVGWTKVEDNWIPPKPYDNWVFDEELNDWIPPIPKPLEEPKGNWFWHQNENAWADLIPTEFIKGVNNG